MKIKLTLLIVSLHFYWCLSAQENLVPNPGFEKYVECPDEFSVVTKAWDSVPPLYLYDWLAPTLGSSDFYHECAPVASLISVPDNVAGHVPAAKGKGYGGIFLLASQNIFHNGSTYREYLQVKLNKPLEKDVEYCISLLTRPLRHNITDSSGYIYAIGEMGMYLSANQPVDNSMATGNLNLPYIPQVKASGYLNGDGWQRVAGVFKAGGGEEWLTIGNFKDDLSVINRFLLESPKAPPTSPFGPLYYSYYFVDEVNVFQIKGTRAMLSDNYLVCEELLPSSFSAREGLDYYQWSTGETTQNVQVDQPGWIYINASFVGCAISDSVLVKAVPAPVVDLGPDISLCDNGQLQTVTLSTVDVLPNYYWSNNNPGPELITNIPGTYKLFTEHLCGHFEDEIVLSGCDVSVYIPNVITPESNDHNSIFTPFGSNIELVLLEIYDHFGRIIYHEYPPVSGWNGYVRGNLVMPGVYMYRIRYRNLTDGVETEKIGDVTVVR